MTEGIPELEMKAVRGTEALPWMREVSEEREDLRVYYNGIHRGEMRHGEGKKMWTDRLMHTVKGIALAGAGWVGEVGNGGQCRIRGEPTIMRAEMGAAGGEEDSARR